MASHWACEQLQSNVFRINIPLRRHKDWEFWVFLASDIHLDSKHCNRKLLKKHLELAQERGAPIIFTGDNFDAMQSRGDKRHEKSDLLPEMIKGTYHDSLIEVCSNWLKPFARSIAIMGDGNHETNVRKSLEIDLNQRLIGYLNILTGSKIHFGNYAGWIFYCFKDGTQLHSKAHHYHHGSGYTSNAAKKVASALWPDANILTFGHDHKAGIHYEDRERVSIGGKQYQDSQLQIKLGTYKDAWGDGARGYEVERAHGAKSLGGYFLRFVWDRGSEEVLVEAIRAQ